MVDFTKDKHNLHFQTDTTDELSSVIKEEKKKQLKAFEDTKSILIILQTSSDKFHEMCRKLFKAE